MQHTEREIKAVLDGLAKTYKDIDNDDIGNAGMEELVSSLPVDDQERVCDIVKSMVANAIDNLCYDLMNNSGIQWQKDNAWIPVDSGILPNRDPIVPGVSVMCHLIYEGMQCTGKYFFNREEWIIDQCGERPHEMVTHFSPFPDPPKK